MCVLSTTWVCVRQPGEHKSFSSTKDFKLVVYFILWIHRFPINVLFKFHPLDRCSFIHKQDTFDFILGYNYDLGPIR